MNYYNSYPQYPYAYPQSQSYAQSNVKSMEWVDGEVGAKAFQMPQGWPPETPIALWDNSDKKIWLKSWNQMGMANPMQEITYQIKETKQNFLPGISGDTSQFVTKDEIEELKEQIKNLTQQMQSKSRGGNQ